MWRRSGERGRGLGTADRGLPVFLEDLPDLGGAPRLEDARAAVRRVGETFRVPGQVLLHLRESVPLAAMILDEGHVAADDAVLVRALLLGGESIEALVEDPRVAQRAPTAHHRLAARLRYHAPGFR